MYIKIYNKLCKINNNGKKKFSKISFLDYLCSRISNFLTPIFIISKISPNQITFINFFIGLMSIALLPSYFDLGIIFFLLFIIFDHVDGSIARLTGKTFFGKFIDATSDALIYSLFFISIALYYYSISENKHLLILGAFSTVFLMIDVLILDKFGALVRWCNEQNKKNNPPYLRETIFLRFFLLLNDLTKFGVFTLPFLSADKKLFQVVYLIIFLSILVSSIINILLHVFFSYKYLNFKKK